MYCISQGYNFCKLVGHHSGMHEMKMQTVMACDLLFHQYKASYLQCYIH